MENIQQPGKDLSVNNNEVEHLKQLLREMEETNKHLVTATFRERDMRKRLDAALKELESSQKIIEDQNRRITESINYARKIQEAINPDEGVLKSVFPDSFILYNPRDVISGDFPWLLKKQQCVYLAAVDCTGHGVPGAMMSMIGTLLLNSICEEDLLPDPGRILDCLHKNIVRTLRQEISSTNSSDGMDIGLVKIDLSSRLIEFAGAHRPLIVCTPQNGVTVIRGDRFSIGGMHYERVRIPFATRSLEFNPGDCIYMFSDGLSDQPGGPEMKKFSALRFTEFVKNAGEIPMDDFKIKFMDYLRDWKGENRQLDDILLLGIRFGEGC